MLDVMLRFLDFQDWPFVVFLSAVLMILVSNVIYMRKLKPPQGIAAGKVSILVPARNEEANIERCVNSLLAQKDVDFELVVMDDGSTDGTSAILARLAAADGRLKVLRGSGPEKGWTGKNYACWRLANVCKGDFLFFTDADTFHESGSAAAVATALRESGAGLVSGMVRQEAGSIGELLLVPLMNWAILCFMPVVLANRSKAPFLSSACGQYMAFERKSYFAIGGHEAVKGQIVEDMELARTMKAEGRKALLMDATGVAGCRMYRGFSDAVNGFTKNLFGIFRYSILVTSFVWIWLLSTVLIPLIFLFVGLLSGKSTFAAPEILSFSISLAIWLIAYAKARVPIFMALMYPVSITLWMILAFKSMFATILGRNRWKSRQLPRPRIKLL